MVVTAGEIYEILNVSAVSAVQCGHQTDVHLPSRTSTLLTYAVTTNQRVSSCGGM